MQHHWEIVNAGKIRASSTAKELWEDACAYFMWSDTHPIKTKKAQTTGKNAGTDLNETTIRPYSLKALCLHCGITEEYIRDIRSMNDKNSDYYHVISRILYVIYVQNAELATIGVYNSIFVSKLLNMDNGDDTPASAIRVEIVQGLPQLSTSENEILKKLELEGKII